MSARAAGLVAGLGAGALLAALFYLAAYDGLEAFHSSIDFNSAPFEDFSGPYWGMGQEVFASGRPVPGFLYSPFFAILLGAYEGVGPSAASWSWLAVQIASTLAVLLLPLLLARPARPWAWAVYAFVGLTSVPLVHGYHWGQVSTLLVALVVGGFVAYDRERYGLAAFLVALAAGIKFYPAFFLVYFVLREDWRTLRQALAWLVVLLVLVPVAVLGAATTWEFYRVVFGTLDAAESRGGTFAAAASRQYVPAVLARALGIEASGAAWLALRLLGFAGAAALLNLVWITERGPGRRVGRALVALCLALPLVVSPSWLHYLAFLPACQLWLWCAPARSGRAARRVLVAVSAVASSMLLFRLVDAPLAFARQGWLCGADLALVAALVLEARAAHREPAE